ncbi:hypothetical protein BJV78DRAFT_452232 [Lactifluus subvellereus]|nr:hypothetical protein BJV78DRAFT_452232 [Lactifluus subvellereus]
MNDSSSAPSSSQSSQLKLPLAPDHSTDSTPTFSNQYKLSAPLSFFDDYTGSSKPKLKRNHLMDAVTSTTAVAMRWISSAICQGPPHATQTPQSPRKGIVCSDRTLPSQERKDVSDHVPNRRTAESRPRHPMRTTERRKSFQLGCTCDVRRDDSRHVKWICCHPPYAHDLERHNLILRERLEKIDVYWGCRIAVF